MMTIHQRLTHSEYVDGCLGCRLGTISVAPSATPSRGEGADAARIISTDRAWDRDMAAYQRLRADGLQPPRIDGAAELERDASIAEHVESGHTDWPEDAVREAAEVMDRRVTTPNVGPSTW